MNREIQNDFEKLLVYFSQYNLEKIISDTSFVCNAKTIHRKLYSYLIFMCEVEQANNLKHQAVLNYYNEAGSDLILALFCWSNGAYKPAEFQLRSSIENFIKASLYDEWNDVINCKSVYEIMDYSTTSSFFGNSICQKALSEIKNVYANLCAFVHSGPNNLMAQRSLIQLPQYNQNNSIEFTRNFQVIVNNLLSIFYYKHFKFIFSIHVTNRELFLQGLTATAKAEIYEECTKD